MKPLLLFSSLSLAFLFACKPSSEEAAAEP